MDRKLTTALAAMGATALSLSMATTASGANPPPPTVTMTYEMNEAPGASVMVDSGTGGHDGQIGTEVETGKVVDGATGYHFPRLKPNTPPAHPEHNVIVPDTDDLDPGSGNYSVEIRYRTTNRFGNLIQKGQAKSSGGQFKIQLPGGRPQCYFKGPLGKDGVGWKHELNDGQWHTLLCVKTADSVTLYVDGIKRRRKVGPMGDINNTFPLSIGGKTKCDQIKVTCDYFGGDVDYVRITKG
jgi:hypothetical protein